MIKIADLNNLVERLNILKKQSIIRFKDGKSVVGHYCLDYTYGDVGLEQITNDCGGVRNITNGHITKREMHGILLAILAMGNGDE